MFGFGEDLVEFLGGLEFYLVCLLVGIGCFNRGDARELSGGKRKGPCLQSLFFLLPSSAGLLRHAAVIPRLGRSRL